jgi:VWFA-related protein
MIRHLRVATVFVLLAGSILRAGQAPAGQAPAGPQTPTFRVAVDYVEVDVLVTDARGNYVRDLKKEDFQIFEDGKPQTLSNFVPVDIPVERGEQALFSKQPVDPDVKSNEQPFGGRVYVMVLDSAHTLPQNTNLMRLAAKKFINDKLGSNDLMAVVSARGAAGGEDYGQEFTNNRRLLNAAVEKFRGTQPRSATLNKIDDFVNHSAQRAAGADTGAPQDIDAKEREYNARAVLEELTAVADWFSVVHGRKKSILYFSEGISYDIHDVFANGGNNAAAMIQLRMQDLVRAATKANASIYAIDPRGLQGLSDASIELTSVDAPGLDERGLQTESRLARESLQAFAGETGGFAVVNTNRLANAFDRIVEENSSYYVLAYYPPNPKRDGKYHNINVRVTRPGLNVRFRRGYANATGKPPAPSKGEMAPELIEALQSPIPLSGLGMKVFAAPFKGVAPNASVLMGVELRGRDLAAAANGKIDLAFSAVDVKGKMKASSRDSLTLNLRPETKARVEQTGIRVLSRMNVPPGRYQLRVAAYDMSGGAVGSVLYDLEVPDFSKDRLAMSGLVITSAAAAALPTAKPDADLRTLLPGPPVAARSFAQNDQVAIFADVYDNDVTPVHKVDITMSLTADAGRVVFKNEDERSTEDLGGKPGGFGFGTTLSLSDFDPGLYVLKVEARSRLGADVVASREVQIRITPPEDKADKADKVEKAGQPR